MLLCGVALLLLADLATLRLVPSARASAVLRLPRGGLRLPRDSNGPHSDCAWRAASDVVRHRSAANTCGALSVEEALLAVTMPVNAARNASAVLAALGFDTAADLELLGGGEAAAEVLAELKAHRLNPADRAKVRLLVGDRDLLKRLSSRPLAAADYASFPSATTSSWSSREAAPMDRRKLQSDGSDDSGMSLDTLAIVVSVLVGAAGYILQAHTARRAERLQGQQAMEQHAAEQARQREHQMMTAQIERTHQSLDQCCRPVQTDIISLAFAKVTIVEQLVVKLEASHPNAVEEMMSFASVGYAIGADGVVTSRSSGKQRWKPRSPELARAMTHHGEQAPSANGYAISNSVVFRTWSQPFCFELPTVILGVVVAEPTGEIAEMYRGYIRHTMMPMVRRVADTFRSHSAYVEMPPKAWLEKTYPHIPWRSVTNSLFIQQWHSYSLSFERVLSEWSDGNFGSVHGGNAWPMGGVLRTLAWSQQRAEATQSELIGMTSVAEIDNDVYTRAASFETKASEPSSLV
eukprot:SAG31_NODE_69_length_28130_cov_15.318219_13_plen_521_part_00